MVLRGGSEEICDLLAVNIAEHGSIWRGLN
jgi:hypothetical protein